MILSPNEQAELFENPWNELLDDLKNELQQAKTQLAEIKLLLDQSQIEVGRLTQRNASASARLQQFQAQFDSIPRADLRSAYDAALDSQQRLFVMRGQIDKLQSDRAHIERHQTYLEKCLKVMESVPTPSVAGSRKSSSPGEIIEMVIQAQEAERQRLARQMHDEPAQALSNFILQTDIAVRLFEIDPAKAKEELGNLKAAASTTFQKVRDFIFELRPMMLDDLGLTPTLNRYLQATKDQSGIDIRLSMTGMDQRLEPYLEVMIFRAVQELVGNAQKHSGASLIKVQLDAYEEEVRVTVDDNGKGFDPAAIERGMGLKLIRDRVEMLNGQMDVDSVLGQGTRVTLIIPAKRSKVFA